MADAIVSNPEITSAPEGENVELTAGQKAARTRAINKANAEAAAMEAPVEADPRGTEVTVMGQKMFVKG
jgi:hypothetical protein